MSNKITKLVQNISKHISNTSMVEVVHRETFASSKRSSERRWRMSGGGSAGARGAGGGRRKRREDEGRGEKVAQGRPGAVLGAGAGASSPCRRRVQHRRWQALRVGAPRCMQAAEVCSGVEPRSAGHAVSSPAGGPTVGPHRRLMRDGGQPQHVDRICVCVDSFHHGVFH